MAYARLPDAEALPGVETARILMVGDREILDVIFAGAESEEALRPTLRPLIAWLQRLEL